VSVRGRRGRTGCTRDAATSLARARRGVTATTGVIHMRRPARTATYASPRRLAHSLRAHTRKTTSELRQRVTARSCEISRRAPRCPVTKGRIAALIRLPGAGRDGSGQASPATRPGGACPVPEPRQAQRRRIAYGRSPRARPGDVCGVGSSGSGGPNGSSGPGREVAPASAARCAWPTRRAPH
jgi:hypothetical protein